MNVARLLTNAARVHPQRRALSHGGTETTYAELDARVTEVAAGLGVAPGDRVVIWSENRAELVDTLFATWRAGAVAVPVNFRLTASEVEEVIADSEASVLCTSFPNAPRNARLIDIADLPVGKNRVDYDARPDELAWLFYTSGTTGRSKGACLTHANLFAMCLSCLANIHRFQPEDVVLHAAPLSHGSGMYLLPAIARGATNIISSEFDPPGIIDIVESEQINVVAFLAPTMIVKLLQDPSLDPARLATLSNIIYGGGPMYVEHLKQAIEVLGPIWTQLYGQGESPMTGTYLRREDHRIDTPQRVARLGSIGIPCTGIDLRIDAKDGEPGELLIRGPTVMAGYWRSPEASAETLQGGWLHTGDVAYQDEHGYVYLVDRLKDMIVTGGTNVYAREVEEVLLTHPGVSEAAVIGVPDPYWGEAVHAVIVTHDDPVDANELVEHCAERLARFKKPKSIAFVDSLPKNAYGKVLKRDLRSRLAETNESQQGVSDT